MSSHYSFTVKHTTCHQASKIFLILNETSHFKSSFKHFTLACHSFGNILVVIFCSYSLIDKSFWHLMILRLKIHFFQICPLISVTWVTQRFPLNHLLLDELVGSILASRFCSHSQIFVTYFRIVTILSILFWAVFIPKDVAWTFHKCIFYTKSVVTIDLMFLDPSSHLGFFALLS